MIDAIIHFLVSHDLILFPLVALCVFTVVYLNADRVIQFLHRKSLGSREEVLRLLDLMFVDVNKKMVTTLMLLGSFGLGVVMFLVLWPNVLFGALVGAGITVLGWSVPKTLVRGLYDKRCNLFVDQMVDGLTIMSNGVKAGLSVTQAMERIVENMKGPIAQEFGLVLNKIRLGMSVEESLNELSERIPRPDVQMFVTAINILKETGGNLAETFATIVTTIRERQKIQKKIQALTAQGIMQAIIISAVPIVLLGVFLLIDPNYVMPLFTKPLGWFMLVLMLTLQIIGGVMMKKTVTIKV